MVSETIDSALLSSLVQDYTVYPRKDVYWQNVASLTEALRAEATLPPIIVDRTTNRVVDGFHRCKAYEAFHGGNNVEVDVEFRDYDSEADLFLDAIRLNATHGQKLSTFDIVRSTKRAEELGLTRAQVAGATGWTLERVEKTLLTRTTADGATLKRTNAHLSGQKLSEKQAKYNQFAGGMTQKFYIAQVVALAESESLDFENEGIVTELNNLGDAYETIIAPRLGR